MISSAMKGRRRPAKPIGGISASVDRIDDRRCVGACGYPSCARCASSVRMECSELTSGRKTWAARNRDSSSSDELLSNDLRYVRADGQVAVDYPFRASDLRNTNSARRLRYRSSPTGMSAITPFSLVAFVSSGRSCLHSTVLHSCSHVVHLANRRRRRRPRARAVPRENPCSSPWMHCFPATGHYARSFAARTSSDTGEREPCRRDQPVIGESGASRRRFHPGLARFREAQPAKIRDDDLRRPASTTRAVDAEEDRRRPQISSPVRHCMADASLFGASALREAA